MTGNIGKLGKLSRTLDKRTLRLENYLDLSSLPELPHLCNQYRSMKKLTMLANDKYGDCVIAGLAHRIQAWTSQAAREVVFSDKKVIDTYFDLTGGADVGLNMLATMNWWRKNGFHRHPLGVYAAIDPKNLISVKYAILLFGGILAGFALPKSIDGQAIWDVPVEGLRGDGAPFSLGGHCIDIASWEDDKGFVCYTWGQMQPLTDDFMINYCDEAYVCLSLDYFTLEHKTPQGFYYRDLLSDLGKITK
jgi:hypothetical protein